MGTGLPPGARSNLKSPRSILLLTAAAVALSGCDLIPGLAPSLGIDKDRFEAAIDPAVGGPDTCLVIKDVRTGAELYRYGLDATCNRALPPCETFQVPLVAIGLTDGKVARGEVWKWDGKVQPFDVWQHDMDLESAWRTGARWWFQRLALAIGPDGFSKGLSAFHYGQGKPIGRPDSFWMGPAARGGLYLSTRNQADILRALARTRLPAKPDAQGAVQGLMLDQSRGATELYDLGGSCSSNADSSRTVSWWVGRIKGPGAGAKDRDVVFALSIESANPLSGREIRSRMLPILTRFRLLPNA